MIGTTVSHYEILERLGSGGMGVVYKARDLRLERPVALKFFSPFRGGGEEDRRRFLREARAASVLDHPNICTVHEIGETEDGRPFIAMAFCSGETLKARLARGPLPIATAAGLAAQIAAGLATAHGHGVVHRDVKPANVIVSPEGRVKLVDFGVAKLADQSRLTRAGTAVGTIAYMAPEQFRGEAVDARTDVWSLGVVLYEMVTGCPPFPGLAERELVDAILYRTPPLLGARRAGVPAELERIVSRALAKSPADRYPEMAAMERDLRSLAAAAPPAETETLLEIFVPCAPAEAPGGSGPHDAGLLGLTVSHFRITEVLGGGGMGVVYKAEDTHLARTVALKFLPPELTRDPEAKARFLQEARAASALDHPNICTIYEVGEAGDGRLFLAMPCYDGETLRKKIESGPLPLDEATEIAKQIAKGLAKAHRQGIVHRDIKPANLVVTNDGVVKILDFGLAKLVGEAGPTRAGTLLGTPAYMSPEQARGETVDHRTDLWSLGVVLYEMVAGRRPFRGDHEQAVLRSLLSGEPEPLPRLRPEVGPELEQVVAGLLAKDPAKRYPDAAGVVADLRALRDETASGTLRTQARPLHVPRSGTPPWVWWGLGAAAAVLAAGIGTLLRPAPPAAPPFQTAFAQLTDQPGSESSPSLSPNGDSFVYTYATAPGNLDIFSQRVDSGAPINLTGDSPVDDGQPAFSPDGRWIAFRSERGGGGIFVMGATGESPRRVTGFGYDPAWSPDGQWLLVATEAVSDPVGRSSVSQLWRVSLTDKRALVSKGDAVQPSWSPNGLRIAYWGLPPGSGRRVIWTIPANSTDGGEPVPVIDDGSLNWNPVWAPDGRHLYFVSDRSGSMNLWRVPIDEASGRVEGPPQPITTPAPWIGFLSVSRDGRRLLYATNEGRSNLERVPFDPVSGSTTGPPVPVTQGSRTVRYGSPSPDGTRLVFNSSMPQEDLFVVQADGGGLRQLTDDREKDRNPQWSPDGSRILFQSNRSGSWEAWSIRPDGGGLEQLTAAGGVQFPLWDPGGRRIVCARSQGAALIDLARPAAQRIPRPLPPAGDRGEIFSATSWSPDGRRLAGHVFLPKAESLVPGIFLYTFASGSYRRLTDRGKGAVWLHDSRRLLYLDGGGVFLLDAENGQSRQVLEPSPDSVVQSMSVSADGSGVYLVRATSEGSVGMLTIE